MNYPKSSLDDLERRYEECVPRLSNRVARLNIAAQADARAHRRAAQHDPSLHAQTFGALGFSWRRLAHRSRAGTKDTALDLPKLSEIIVPISMRPLQKQVYKGILTRNVGDITAIYSKKKSKSGPARFQNILMELRKDLGHPYLNDPLIEPREVTDEQAHRNLVEASGKLVFLQKFLPKLKERGHRTLIFSQFRIFLDILERFFEGERVRFLRLVRVLPVRLWPREGKC